MSKKVLAIKLSWEENLIVVEERTLIDLRKAGINGQLVVHPDGSIATNGFNFVSHLCDPTRKEGDRRILRFSGNKVSLEGPKDHFLVLFLPRSVRLGEMKGKRGLVKVEWVDMWTYGRQPQR